MYSGGHLVIGAECGMRIGTGHVMRCMALAQRWRHAGGGVTFVVPEGSAGIEERTRGEGFSMETIAAGKFCEAAVERMIELQPQVAVLDGYGFDGAAQAALNGAGVALMAIDDYGHATEYCARWILNQGVNADAEMYARRSEDTKLLLGPDYALLRDEFLPWMNWERAIVTKSRKILVPIGGSDPENLSLRIGECVAALGRAELEVAIVVGGSNPHIRSLEQAAERSAAATRIVNNALDMPSLMAWADVAISGAGGTSYELCFMGLPALLFVIAENQRGGAEGLAKLGAAVSAGGAREFDAQRFAGELQDLIDGEDRRQVMSRRARELVDGLGADRVRAALADREIRLRALRATDCELLFSWANDLAVREASFRSNRILWEEHERWFAEKSRDPQTVIYVGESVAGEPVGQVRFELEGESATLSVVVAPKFRGAGWGKELLFFSTRRLARTRSTRHVRAFVKPENRASIRLFESSGFRQAEVSEVLGQAARLFVWECGSDHDAA